MGRVTLKGRSDGGLELRSKFSTGLPLSIALRSVLCLSLSTAAVLPAAAAGAKTADGSAERVADADGVEPGTPDGARPWKGQLVYGRDLMTIEERRAYRAGMRRQQTYEDELAYWRAHVEKMQQRAWERGLPIDPAPEVMTPSELERRRAPIFSIGFMTGEEIEAYRAAEADLIAREVPLEEYEAFVRAHVEKMRKRAWERGWAIDPEEEEREARREERVGKALAYRKAVREALAEKAQKAAAEAGPADAGTAD